MPLNEDEPGQTLTPWFFLSSKYCTGLKCFVVEGHVYSVTHTDATHEDNGEGLQDACCANDPGKAQKENHTQDVLHARQINSNERSHLGHLEMQRHTDM